MKKKTKTILTIIIAVLIVAVAAVGTVAFLKDSGEASAASEEEGRILPVAGSDEEQTQNGDEGNLPETIGDNENAPVEGTNNQEVDDNANGVQSTTPRTNNANNPRVTPVEPASTTVEQERLVSETLSWSNISLNSTIANRNLNYGNLKYTIEYYYDGQLDESKTENKVAAFEEVITEFDDKNIEGYGLEKTENLPLTIGANQAENLIKVYYSRPEYKVEKTSSIEKAEGNTVEDRAELGDKIHYIVKVTNTGKVDIDEIEDLVSDCHITSAKKHNVNIQIIKTHKKT